MVATNTMRSGPKGASPLFSAVASLSGAQRALLTEIATHRDPVTVTELSEAMDLHPNSIRATLDSLQNAKLVGRDQLRSPGRGRPSWGYYTMGPTQDSFVTHQLTDLTSVFCDQLRELSDDPYADAYDVGEKWADKVLESCEPQQVEDVLSEPIEAIIGQVRMFFTSLGYAATIKDGDDRVVELRSCPFMDEQGDVDPLMCEVHRGMCARSLTKASSGRIDCELVPLAGPEVCEVRVVDLKS